MTNSALVSPEAPPVGGANVVVTSAAGAQNETTIALDPTSPSNLIGGANDYRGGDSTCGRYRTTNNGRTWTDSGTFAMFTPAGGYAYSTAGDAGVAFDANGHAYYLCMYFTRMPGNDATQYVHKSNDGGATWGPPIPASNAAAQSNFDDKGHIAVDNVSFTANRGNVYVAWVRLNASQVRFARSTNGAVSFENDIQVNDAGNAGSGANIAVGIDGDVYVAWRAGTRILIDKSTDGGQTFGALAGGTDHVVRNMTAGTGSVRPLSRVNSFPVIGTDPINANLLYAVWAEDAPGADDSDIMFARSFDGGDTWSAAIRVNDDINALGDFNSQFFPWLAVDPTDGSVNVVWYDDRTDPNHTDGTPLVDLFFASSNDAGLSFSLNTRISTQSSNTNANFSPQFFGDYNAIAAYAGVAHPLWTDSRTGGQDLMTTQVGGADLAITKSAPAQVTAGMTISYGISVTNNGPAVAFNVVVTDSLPLSVTYAGSTVPCAGSPLACTVGNLAPGSTATFTITGQVSANATPGSTLTNNASVAADQGDPNPGDNTATASTIVIASADLRLTKECKPDQPNAQPAGTSTYCDIYVDNLGPSAASNVVVTDQIISSTPFVVNSVVAAETPVDPTVPACMTSGVTATTATVTCTDTLLPSGSRITVRVTFTADDAGDVNDTASVTSATPDPNTSNNLAVGRVSFRSVADLAIDKSSDADVYKPSSVVTYSIYVVNNGPSKALNVVVTDKLPDLKQALYQSDTGGCVFATPKTLKCNLGDLAAGDSKTFFVSVLIKGNKGLVDNTASVASPTPDPDLLNNSDTHNVTIGK